MKSFVVWQSSLLLTIVSSAFGRPNLLGSILHSSAEKSADFSAKLPLVAELVFSMGKVASPRDGSKVWQKPSVVAANRSGRLAVRNGRSVNGLQPSGSSSKVTVVSAESRRSKNWPVSSDQPLLEQKEISRSILRNSLAPKSQDKAGFLLQKTKKPNTLKSYLKGYRRFLNCTARPSRLVGSLVDKALFKEITKAFFNGEGYSGSKNMVYGTAHHLKLDPKVDLPTATTALGNFAPHCQPKLKDPPTWEQAVIQANWVVTEWPCQAGAEVAASILVQFDQYNRPMEQLSMKRNWVVQGPKGELYVTLFPVFQEATSKTHSQDDTNVVGISGRSLAKQVLLELLRLKSGEDLLCKASYPQYRKWIQKSAVACKFPKTLPHDFRHAGASMDGFCGHPAFFVRGRGNWGSESAMIRYHKPGRYARSLAKLSEQQKTLAQNLLKGQFMDKYRRALRR